ncbi:cyclin-like protein interacting with PHO85 [Coemansia aciculifera]|uniref:Cyclin-like protein interacting with PHO85 n=1 Tax=Coemansia aciculifera TaxID=417176 RepID=A0A9W8ITS6_9FUNG|nr:cyclin-like protein interacting with PHO85 [Coemansia aciculifera]KAJ2876307.1 cyclin-like protein interacting with PHO85 [Coemansia aciculifera]
MFDIEHTPIPVTIARMAELIDSVTYANHRSLGPIINDITPFHSRAVPAISVHDYLERVAKFVCLENDSLIAVLVYLDRVTRAQIHRPALAPSPFNIHRLLITAIVVAHKFNSDVFFNNARYSKVGGIPLAEMNQLELELLFMARFDLKIDAPEMQRIGEWLLTPRTTRNPYQQHPECVLSAYHADVALARHAELCKLEYPTPAMDPMTASSSSAAVPPLDLTASFAAPPAHNATPQSRNTSGHYYVPPLPLAQGSMPMELTTPASLPTSCPPTTPPCRGCPSCEIDQNGVVIGQLDGPTHICPHVAVGSQRGHHIAANSFDSGVSWTDNGAFAPGNAVLDCVLTQKRRRMQALGVHPALAVPGGGINITTDVNASVMTPLAVNVGGGTDDE